jgi:ribose transport system substrate-binding protein
VGYATATYLLRALHGKGQVIMIEGTPGSTTSPARTRGFHAALAEFPNVKLLASASGNYQEPEGYAAAVKLLAAYPQIDGVISANDSMSFGIIRAFEEAKRKALVVSINATIAGAREIGAGRLLASEDYNAFTMGCLALYAAVRHGRGQPVPAELMIPIKMVDATNYAAWLTPLASRSCPSWEELTADVGSGR